MSHTPASIVLDTSVAIKWFFKEPYEKEALLLRDAFREGACPLFAPDLIYPEFANTVWKRVNFNNLAPEEGIRIIRIFQRVPLEIAASRDLLEEAFSIAGQHKCTVYDALFLALGNERSCRIITADRKFYEAVSVTFPNMMWIEEFKV
ncbi:MAG: type II toxin-antitoxin system VapC family toxin [Desulfovibrionales bacterium]|nr:type II toxin-antitoxin system VapC family toxin [Desulfovibrionales bacterium]